MRDDQTNFGGWWATGEDAPTWVHDTTVATVAEWIRQEQPISAMTWENILNYVANAEILAAEIIVQLRDYTHVRKLTRASVAYRNITARLREPAEYIREALRIYSNPEERDADPRFARLHSSASQADDTAERITAAPVEVPDESPEELDRRRNIRLALARDNIIGPFLPPVGAAETPQMANINGQRIRLHRCTDEDVATFTGGQIGVMSALSVQYAHATERDSDWVDLLSVAGLLSRLNMVSVGGLQTGSGTIVTTPAWLMGAGGPRMYLDLCALSDGNCALQPFVTAPIVCVEFADGFCTQGLLLRRNPEPALRRDGGSYRIALPLDNVVAFYEYWNAPDPEPPVPEEEVPVVERRRRAPIILEEE